MDFLFVITVSVFKWKSVEVGVFRRGGSLWAQISGGRGGVAHQPLFISENYRVIALSCRIKMSAVYCLVLSQSTRVTETGGMHSLKCAVLLYHDTRVATWGILFICRRRREWPYEITFSGITPANKNRSGRNLTGRRRVTQHAPMQMFDALHKTGAKWRGKKRILRTFVTQTTHHTPADDFREFEHKRCISVVMKTFGTEFRCFPKNSFLGFSGYTYSGRTPALSSESEHCIL